MASLNLNLSDEFKAELKAFRWVNWSEVSREEILKKDIFDRYMNAGKITDDDWMFCEKIDWHPVDELPLKEEFVKQLEQRRKGPFTRLKSVNEIFRE